MEIKLKQSLKQHLETTDQTQNQLASRIGIRPSSFHAYINGAIPRGLETIIKMAGELNISLDELVFNRNPIGHKSTIVLSEKLLFKLLGEYELVISKKANKNEDI